MGQSHFAHARRMTCGDHVPICAYRGLAAEDCWHKKVTITLTDHSILAV
jgi:hypothetical protein